MSDQHTASSQVLLLSSSTIHGSAYLEYAIPYLDSFLSSAKSILFIPYARPGGRTHAEYSELFKNGSKPLGRQVTGLEEYDDPIEAVQQAEAVFVGGGNTFVLVKQLYETGLMEVIRQKVKAGMPYIGSSAGTNVAGMSMSTSNDMPIVYPPSFETLGLVPFNINPHYIDPDPQSTHKGETREERIQEFLVFNAQPVVGLREGAILKMQNSQVILTGVKGARVFRKGQDPQEFLPDIELDCLMHT